MKSVEEKTSTRRTARAASSIKASAEVLDRLEQNEVPKPDILPIARAAGILAAKRTPDLIPYCHPLLIDHVEITFVRRGTVLEIEAVVTAVAKTGVEMEALVAVSIAALTVYDMLKPIAAELVLGETRLVEKRGGKSSFKETLPDNFKAAVIVTSDGTARGTRQDNSGKLIIERLRSQGIEAEYRILPDDLEQITLLLRHYIAEQFQLVLSTGGTGLGPRDVTVEATRAVIEREIPGIAEAARAYGQERTPYSMLSRALAGQAGGTIIVNLPGSSRGVIEGLNAIFPAVLHSYKMMAGEGH